MKQAEPVTERLLLEMKDAARREASELVIVSLVPNSQYANYMTGHGIRLLDCGRDLTASLKVPGEGHPNGEMHAFWAQCIADGLIRNGLLDGSAPEPPAH